MMKYLDDLKKRTSARLLIVDDESRVCSLIAHMLRHAGYTVEEANSGQEALALLERTYYDLMVLDLQMPDMSGLEVMRRARQLCPDLLVIILTGYATLESAIAGAKSDEVVDYLCKPVGNQELIEAVAQAIEKHTKHLLQQRLFNVVCRVLDNPAEFETLIEVKRLATSSGSDSDTIIAPPLMLNRKKRIVTFDNNSSSAIDLTKGETALLAACRRDKHIDNLKSLLPPQLMVKSNLCQPKATSLNPLSPE